MKQTTVSARVDSVVKDMSEDILNELGISMSTAITMFLKQVIINQGLPFNVNLNRPLDYSKMTKAEFDQAIEAGFEDIKKGKVYRIENDSAELMVSEEDITKTYGKRKK